MADLLGTRRYDSGMHDARGGSVQPLAYARGLARAAMEEGAVIHRASEAVAVVRHGAGWSVRTDRASVECEFVVLATNGYTGDLWPGLRRSLVPVASFVTATAPLGHNVLPTVLPGRHAVSETARIIVYYRLDGQGRFIIGGRGRWFNVTDRGDVSHVRAAALHLFPQLEGTRWEYEWAGWPAITRDHLPKLFALERGVYAGLGYNGRGVASATMMGQQLANVVLAEAEPLVEVRGPERFAFHRFPPGRHQLPPAHRHAARSLRPPRGGVTGRSGRVGLDLPAPAPAMLHHCNPLPISGHPCRCQSAPCGSTASVSHGGSCHFSSSIAQAAS